MGHGTEVDIADLSGLLIKAAKHTAEFAVMHCEDVLAHQVTLEQTGYSEDLEYVTRMILEDLWSLVPGEAAFGPFACAVHETVQWVSVRIQMRMLGASQPPRKRLTWNPSRNPDRRTLESIVTERAVLLWHELHELGLIVDEALDYAA